MWQSKLIFCLVLVVAILFSILYMPVLSVYLLVSLLCVALLLFFVAHWCGTHVQASLDFPKTPATANQPCQGTVIVQSSTRLPITRVRVMIQATEMPFQETLDLRVHGAVTKNHPAHLPFTCTPQHCGTLHVAISQLRTYDWLTLFSHRRTICEEASVVILPVLSLPEAKSEKTTAPGDKHMTPTKAPGEFFQIRDYRPGDRPRDVHWKLSCRTPDLMVREFGEPKQKTWTAAWIYALYAEDIDKPDRLDTMLEAILALWHWANTQGHVLHLHICRDDTCQVAKIHTTDDLTTALRETCDTIPSRDPDACLQTLQAESEPALSVLIDQPTGVVFRVGTAEYMLAPHTAAETIMRALEEATP